MYEKKEKTPLPGGDRRKIICILEGKQGKYVFVIIVIRIPYSLFIESNIKKKRVELNFLLIFDYGKTRVILKEFIQGKFQCICVSCKERERKKKERKEKTKEKKGRRKRQERRKTKKKKKSRRRRR